MKEHRLKIWPSYFEAVASGAKPFEWRRNDRDYAVGDVLILCEWEPPGMALYRGRFTGRELRAVVTYKAEGVFEIPPGFCVLGIRLEAAK